VLVTVLHRRSWLVPASVVNVVQHGGRTNGSRYKRRYVTFMAYMPQGAMKPMMAPLEHLCAHGQFCASLLHNRHAGRE